MSRADVAEGRIGEAATPTTPPEQMRIVTATLHRRLQQMKVVL